jgi:7-carboxy-7-deazaguanine synthase
MKNLQPPVGRDISAGFTLNVHSIFNTIQGEGPFAGRPAVFVRLAGCNLQCPLCDTEYTSDTRMTVQEILIAVMDHAPQLVVITGGEPLRQNIVPLCLALLREGIHPQIESNGKLPPQDPAVFFSLLSDARGVSYVLSPKTHRVDPDLAYRATAWKFVVQHGDVAVDGLPIKALDHPVPAGYTIARPPRDYKGDIYVQPADEKDEQLNALNMQAAVDAVMMGGKRRLCLQMHKYANLD